MDHLYNCKRTSTCQEEKGKSIILTSLYTLLTILLGRVISISAGRNHLIALTSSGRTFAHPFFKDSNSHGQLGTRKVYFQTPSESGTLSERVNVELIPVSQLDPYRNSSRVSRVSSDSTPSTEAESSAALEGVRYCDTLFEIPSLRGVRIAQAVAGDRSSLVRTEDGRVLGWGANEYGSDHLLFSAISHAYVLIQIGVDMI